MKKLIVYDKAKYHFEGDYPKGLPISQAYVHSGIYLAWLWEHRFLTDEIQSDFKDIMDQYKKRTILPGEAFRILGGALVSDMLSVEGNAFTVIYFDFDHGHYLTDYRQILTATLPSFYHADDSWTSYDKIKSKIDERYLLWKKC